MKPQRKTAITRDAGFTQVWFLVEGRGVRFRCEHRAGWFRLGQVDGGWTELTCTHGKHHRVLSGFYLESPEAAEDQFEWYGKPLRGVQLKLPFPERGALRFGNVQMAKGSGR